MAATPPPMPRTVEDVFNDFKGRRAGIVKALTVDVNEFYLQCAPGKENLCLYGLPNKTWEVKMPEEDVPPELPEPVVGINFVKDGMQEKDWVSCVAAHSDSWLLSVAFYYGGRFRFGKSDRGRLFEMINGCPTLYEEVVLRVLHNSGSDSKSQQPEPLPTVEAISAPIAVRQVKTQAEDLSVVPRAVTVPIAVRQVKKQAEDLSVVPRAVRQVKKQAATHNNGSNRKSQQPKPVPNVVALSAPKDKDEEEDDKQGTTLCGACDERYEDNGEFWIFCDICEGWFHGKCVRITPAKAQHMKQYKCPTCRRNRRDQD